MVGWWVPADDENSIGFHVELVDPNKKIFQPPDVPVIRDYETKQRAPDDWEAQTSQRSIARHTLEHLATSDRGVVLFRRHLSEAIDAIERGEDPPGITRKQKEQVIVVPSGNEVIAPN
jgi:hypothetical protein